MKSPILATACGDLFIEDLAEGTIHFLSVSAPELSLVAKTKDAFELMFSQSSFVEAYLHPERVAMLRDNGLVLRKNQIYSFAIPLSLGGQISVDNIDVTDIEVHFSIAGQIEGQIADLPVGTPISGLKTQKVRRSNSWWKFW